MGKLSIEKTRVLIVEDQDISAKYFETHLETTGRYILAGSVKNASLAPAFCESGRADLVLMDVYTENGASGLEAAAKIKEKNPSVRIIIITSLPEVSYIERARAIGIESFWYKQADAASLFDICDRTMAGESIYPEESPVMMVGLARSDEFTDRELDILRELVSGASNAEIAEKLYLSSATVRDYVSSMMRKTGFNSRTKLAVSAREIGLVIPD